MNLVETECFDVDVFDVDVVNILVVLGTVNFLVFVSALMERVAVVRGSVIAV